MILLRGTKTPVITHYEHCPPTPHHGCCKSLRTFLPIVPNKQPGDVEAKIETPANEESIGQNCWLGVNIAITIPAWTNSHR